MIRRPMMRRAIVAGLAMAFVAAPIRGAAAKVAEGTDGIPPHICNYHWQKGPWHIRQLIRCAARRWDSPGPPGKAIEVARCESRLNPHAYNSGGYAGLYQQATRYWPGRAERFGQPDRSVFNARANIIVSIRMARSIGSWSAWAGCA